MTTASSPFKVHVKIMFLHFAVLIYSMKIYLVKVVGEVTANIGPIYGN